MASIIKKTKKGKGKGALKPAVSKIKERQQDTERQGENPNMSLVDYASSSDDDDPDNIEEEDEKHHHQQELHEEQESKPQIEAQPAKPQISQ